MFDTFMCGGWGVIGGSWPFVSTPGVKRIQEKSFNLSLLSGLRGLMGNKACDIHFSLYDIHNFGKQSIYIHA